MKAKGTPPVFAKTPEAVEINPFRIGMGNLVTASANTNPRINEIAAESTES
jgi:tRNA G46 methylase TrmB